MLRRESTNSVCTEWYSTLLDNYCRVRDSLEHFLRTIFTTEPLKLSWSIVSSIWEGGPSHTHNPLVSFNHGIKVMTLHGAADIRMTILAEGLSDPRRYNAPTAPKIAVFMPGDGYTEHQGSRDIVLHAESGMMLQYISENNCSYDPCTT